MPSPDLIRTVSIPCACAFFAIALSLPCEERLRYQIHIPSPASGLFGASALVCAEASPPSGPTERARARAAASRTRLFLRRRRRSGPRRWGEEHASARTVEGRL